MFADSSSPIDHGGLLVTATRIERARSVIGTSAENRAPSATTISAGAARANSSAREFVSHGTMRNEPVESSTSAIAALALIVTIAATTFCAPDSSSASSTRVPGVTTRTTARSTTPFASFGSWICSQTATRSPCSTSLRKYPSAA